MKNLAALLSLLLLTVLCLYSYYYHDRYYPSVSDFLGNPEKYDGMRIEAVGYARNVTSNSFYLERDGLTVKVIGFGVDDGAYLGISGVLTKAGYIAGENYRLNCNYLIKYVASFIGFLLLAIIFFREWKLTFRGFENA